MEPYFSKARLLSFFWLFGIEAPAACAFTYYLSTMYSPADCPATQAERLTWILQRICLTVVPSFSYVWGCMRAFDADTKCEDPFAGVETKRFKTVHSSLSRACTRLCLTPLPCTPLPYTSALHASALHAAPPSHHRSSKRF